MKIGMIDKVELSGIIVLFVGVFLLAFTFFSAYTFLAGNLNILATRDILQVFGESLAPLIEAVIRILYLGIMGWVSSILTIRAVQLLKKERTEVALPQPPHVKTEIKQAARQEPQPTTTETKTEAEKPITVKKEEEKKEAPQEPKKVEEPEEAPAPPQPAPVPTPTPVPA